MLSGQDIICISSADWDAPLWTNKQHLMSRLAQSNRVLYVESVGLRVPTLARQDRSRLARRLRHYLAGPRPLPPDSGRERTGLYILSPLLVPFYRSTRIRNLNARLLLREVDGVRRQLGMRRPILWSYVPNAYALVGQLDEQLVVYHCVDDLASVAGVPHDAVREMEQRFLRLADVVFTTSRALYEERRLVNPRTYYFPNVADPEHFGRALAPETRIPVGLRRLNRPIAGYVGALDAYKVDFVLLAEVAKRLPGWAFVLVGPVGQGQPSTDLGELRTLKNVFFPGRVPYGEVPGYLKAFDVALIPHHVNAYTTASFPMKLYEYLSAGLPVVSTPLPSIRHVDLVQFADSAQAFADAIVEAGRHKGPEEVARRVAEAKRHTWEQRIADFSAVLAAVEREKALPVPSG